MWFAYLIPKHDHHLLVEDGIGYVAKGESQVEAEAAVLMQLRGDEDDEGYAELSAEHVLHSVEL